MNNVIYKIINIQNQKFYVGSTTSFSERSHTHKKKLRSGKHHCAHLQAAWNKYGEENFVFVVVERLAHHSELQAAEDRWLEAWVGKPECYNVGTRSGAPMRGKTKEQHPNFGKPVSEAQRVAISETLQRYYRADPANHPRFGKHHSDEVRAEISRKRKGKCAGADHYRFGKTVSEEVRKKIGDTQRGKSKAPRVISEEGMAKIRAAAEAGHYDHWKGRHHTDESRKKMGRKVLLMPENVVYDTITELRTATGMSIPTAQRALKSGKPIARGQFEGWTLQYVGGTM
jgi:group I intron endonuclease